jgi:hypothetical protein
MTKQLTERELIQLQIQAYDFYASLIDRAVGHGSSPKLPRWDDERALEYKRLADQLRQRLAELEASDPAFLEKPATQPIPANPPRSPSAGSEEMSIGTITAG